MTAARAVRLEPFDERLRVESMRDTPLKRDLSALRRTVRATKNFPAMADLSKLEDQLRRFLDTHGDTPEAAAFPRTQIRVKVVEIAISPEFDRLESRTISDRGL